MPEVNMYALEVPQLYTVMHIFTVFIVPLNFFSIYVIGWHTPLQMRDYSRYLLLHQAIAIITDLSCMLLTTPLMTIPVIGGIAAGPITALGVSTNAQSAYGTVVVITVVTATVQLFYQRQQSILPANSILKLKGKWTLDTAQVIIWSLPVIALVFGCWVFSQPQCDKKALVKKYPTLRVMASRSNYICMSEESMHQTLIWALPTITITCSLIIICLNTSIYYLYCLNFHVSKKTRDMQKRMLLALIVQKKQLGSDPIGISTTIPRFFLIIPFGLILTPISVAIYIVMNERIDLVHFNPWLIFCFGLHGPCSTILILVLYAPYLDYVRKLLGEFRNKVFGKTVTPMIFVVSEITVSTRSEGGTLDRK